jgi:hypothetical protein
LFILLKKLFIKLKNNKRNYRSSYSNYVKNIYSQNYNLNTILYLRSRFERKYPFKKNIMLFKKRSRIYSVIRRLNRYSYTLLSSKR